mmetsp:Transcript_986/g.3132  ORF Transcript_986/g.3132 Transcript_986/m.3132 type:complete len:223 (-) Transcript_986:80-748(-)
MNAMLPVRYTPARRGGNTTPSRRGTAASSTAAWSASWNKSWAGAAPGMLPDLGSSGCPSSVRSSTCSTNLSSDELPSSSRLARRNTSTSSAMMPRAAQASADTGKGFHSRPHSCANRARALHMSAAANSTNSSSPSKRFASSKDAVRGPKSWPTGPESRPCTVCHRRHRASSWPHKPSTSLQKPIESGGFVQVSAPDPPPPTPAAVPRNECSLAAVSPLMPR